MATGTEGPDFLVNDPSVAFDVINALGGDDQITISNTNINQVVTVDGGGGVDTLIYSGAVWGGSPGSITTGLGTLAPRNALNHSGVERLIIKGSATSQDQFPGFAFPVYLTTGDTIDDIMLGAIRFADVHVSTGGGDDKVVLLDGVGRFSSVHGGSGNDRIDFASAFGWFSAFGEDGDDILLGGRDADYLDGGSGDDFLSPGPGMSDNAFVDYAIGGEGNDTIYFGGYLDFSDRVEGGSGTDRLVLQGDYGSGLVLRAVSLTGVEIVSLLSSSDTAFSGGGSSPNDYLLTVQDLNFAAGIQARIDGAGLLAGEDLTFNGSAETNAHFLFLAGKGTDRLTGGGGNDIFFFGEDGRFAPGDSVNGGAGYDGLFLRGNYTINFNAPGYAGAIANLENLTLSSATDVRYASGGGEEFDYYILWADSLLGAGLTITVNGGQLQAGETLTFEGSRERDGSFRIFAGAGNDLLTGGTGADLIAGGLGADRMIGGGGNDVFRFDSVADSIAAARDTVRDFTSGDLIDLSRIDANALVAGDQAFAFIGTAAFGHNAGELRLESQSGTTWLVQGDTDGDGTADFELQLVVVDAHPITGGDFLP